MKKIIEKIKAIICGVKREPVDVMSTGFHSYYPQNQPSEEEWRNEFKFGSRYGHRGSFYQKH